MIISLGFTIAIWSHDRATLPFYLFSAVLGLAPWAMWLANRWSGTYRGMIRRELASERDRLDKRIKAEQVHLRATTSLNARRQ